jgi:acetyltransferase-like isoleucine patch superfamily enzyme
MKRIFNKLFKLFLGKYLHSENQNQHPSNVKKGVNVSIETSALFICPKDGYIELEGNNYIGRNVEISPLSKILVGSYTSIQDRCILLGDIEIGRYCIFAPNVYLSSGRHYYGLKPELYIRDQDYTVRNDVKLSEKHSRKIIIEDDCWLGINVVISSGVTIGKGSVVGANSVVTKNVAPYSIVAGAPSTLIKKRLLFELKDSISFLNDLDLPYFYNGFFTSLNCLEEDRKKGGLRVMKKISAYLKFEGKSQIILELKKNGNESIRVRYNNQTKEILTGKISNISFDIKKTEIHTFDFSSSKENINFDVENCLFIQSIKTV